MTSVSPSPLLRQALLSDAVTTAASALLMLAGGGWLAGLLGLPSALIYGAGLVLVPYAALVAALGLRPVLARGAVRAVVAANGAWAVGSVVLVAGGFVRPTAAGYAFVLGQAAVVALYAELQAIGLRRSLAPAQ
jgi:hypothetical protein